jgi:hypothetical protein
MKYFWSLVFISIGVVLLGSGLGYWKASIVWQLWRFWPLIIIFAGLSLITYDKKWGPLVMIAAVAISGFLIYDAVFSKNPMVIHLDSERESSQTVKKEISVDANNDAVSGRVKIDSAAVEINIGEKSEKFVSGQLSSNVFAPVVSDKTESGMQSVNISTKSNKSNTWLWLEGIKNKLTLALTDKLPVELTVDSGASTLNLDLEQYILSALTVDAGASAIDIRLGEKVKNGAKIVVDAGASTIKISLPKGVGTRIKFDSGLTTKNLSGFTENGSYYENESYKTSEKKIEIELKAGVSTIDVVQF